MEFNRLFSLLGNDKTTESFITNVSAGRFEMPYLVTETIKMLSDDSPYLNIISDTNKISLTKMIQQYYNTCMHVFLEDIDLENIIKQGKIEIYKVEAHNGVRYATTNEIANGVKELMGENFYPSGEEEYKLLCLLYWSFTGRKYYFKEAGFKLTYINNKETKETLYNMIQMSAYKLKDMFTWVSDQTNIDNTIKIIKKYKGKGYKYASYETDEIEETISIKQLIYNIYDTFPRNSNNMEYRRGLALAIKGKESFRNLSPLDIAFLRKVYYKRALDTTQREKEVNQQLKRECELLEKEQYKGKISPDHFVYKIIKTLKSKKYTQCSDKQYNIIKQALDIINKEEKPEDSNMVIMDDTIIDNAIEENNIESISNQLGEGLLFDEMFNDMEDIFS